ncbi:DeoR/GlpR family DNA-binding transcription regulator [Streptomyces sp. HU2014]|uniref:DeoR/GlpR family DNA-binding transcription regulator n=1 Tax=Streptomyces sp. HU2014 TaxID=2939414 RepID=UPI0020109AD2|nr:DeoR/GlpR family DNA-binding transcription regulator [Streptomyces sp. HU2014]UQI45666.1 DeoR/GlpR family DNA-binding transcription regulator [Streptomyces sp. HU2014]
MEAEERRHRIVGTARRDGSVNVAELAAHLGVAKETVRRDLRVLEDHGLVRRTHGGAYPVESAGYESAPAPRTRTHAAERTRIAAGAAALLGDAESVFVDEGRTPRLIAAALPRERPLTVVTASLATAALLAARDNVTVMLLGGRVRGETMATVDHWAARMLAGLVIDLAYIGADGISWEYGLTTPDPAVSEVKRQAVRVSRRRVFSGVCTKFGAVSFCRFAEPAEFEALVTDTRLPRSEAHRYSLLGPQVLRV